MLDEIFQYYQLYCSSLEFSLFFFALLRLLVFNILCGLVQMLLFIKNKWSDIVRFYMHNQIDVCDMEVDDENQMMMNMIMFEISRIIAAQITTSF